MVLNIRADDGELVTPRNAGASTETVSSRLIALGYFFLWGFYHEEIMDLHGSLHRWNGRGDNLQVLYREATQERYLLSQVL